MIPADMISAIEALIPKVEYAGFIYEIVVNRDGSAAWASPAHGQHRAAAKEKHRRAAIEEFNRTRKA